MRGSQAAALVASNVSGCHNVAMQLESHNQQMDVNDGELSGL